MNKISITLIGFLAIMIFTGSAFAAAFTNTGPGVATTIAGANSAALVFTPSPGILLDGITSDTQFTVIAGNQKALDNAIVYLMINGSPSVYQVAQDLTSATNGASLTGSGYAVGVSTAFTKRE